MDVITYATLLAAQHESLARAATDERERRAHLSTMRLIDAAAMMLCTGVEPIRAGDVYLIASRSGAGVRRVNLANHTCSCPAGINSKPCTHLILTQIYIDAESAESADEPDRYAPAVLPGLMPSQDDTPAEPESAESITSRIDATFDEIRNDEWYLIAGETES